MSDTVDDRDSDGKATYVVTAKITTEQLMERDEEVTGYELQTFFYLQELHRSPDASVLEYAGLRYRG